MEQHQGFSLIEGLLSLMLIAGIALTLMQQQLSSIQFLHHLIRTAKSTNFISNQFELTRIHTL